MAVQDKKVTDLTPLENVTSDDLLLVVNDPNGNPTSRRVSFGGVFGNVNFNTAFTANVSVNGTDVFQGISDRLQVANATVLLNNKISVSNTITLIAESANTILENFAEVILNDGVVIQSANIFLNATANTFFANNTVSVKDAVIIREKTTDPATSNAEIEGVTAGSMFYSNTHLYIATSNTTIKRISLDSF